jgi:hypothetical protein
MPETYRRTPDGRVIYALARSLSKPAERTILTMLTGAGATAWCNVGAVQPASAKESIMAKKKETVSGKRGPRREHWKDEPDEHDFPAAADYLTLLVSDQVAASARPAGHSTLPTPRAARPTDAADAGLLRAPKADAHRRTTAHGPHVSRRRGARKTMTSPNSVTSATHSVSVTLASGPAQ